VTVNGEVCTMRGKKIHDGDEIAYNGEVIHVHQHT
jgi:ribosome-associated protein YbcJ (S4-like RNA binding protein)